MKGKRAYLASVNHEVGLPVLDSNEKIYVEQARQLERSVSATSKVIRRVRREAAVLSRRLTKFSRRREKFMPGNVPRFVRCYDNSETDEASADCFTVVFTGRYRDRKTGGMFVYVAMNARPFHPQGIGMHDESRTQIDAPEGWAPAMGRKCHLGRRIPFQQLPRDCRRLVMHDYLYLWDLVPEAHGTEIDYSVVDQFITEDEEADGEKSP